MLVFSKANSKKPSLPKTKDQRLKTSTLKQQSYFPISLKINVLKGVAQPMQPFCLLMLFKFAPVNDDTAVTLQPIFFNQKNTTMGRIQKGILGGFSGKVGTVIGANWKGIDYMRSKAVKKPSNPSFAQMEQQARFGLMMKFLRTFGSLLSTTFHDFANGVTGPNAALSYNLRNAITGIYPALDIDYALVLLSRGNLQNATAPTAIAGAAGKVKFNWTDNSGTGTAQSTDQAILIVYCPATGQSVYNANIATRAAKTATLDVTPFSGKTVQTWIAFIADNGRDVSDSLFTGQVNVL